MPAPTPTPTRAPAPGGSEAPSGAPERGRDGLVLVAAGAVLALAVGWAAGRSGASTTTLGRALGRLDGGAGVLLVLLAAAAQLRVTTRALADRPPVDARAWGVRVLRGVLVPWWVVVTVALFLFPTAAGTLVPSDGATPTWVVVLREWLLAGSLAPSPRLGLGWVVTTVAVGALLLPGWERVLRRVGGDPVALAVRAGVVLGAVGLVVRLGAASTDAAGWGAVVRTMPPAQLDLVGAGIVVGALVAAARRGRGPLAGGVDRRLVAGGVAVVALVALAGVLSPDVGSLLDPGGVGRTLGARLVLAVVGAGLALLALSPRPPSSSGEIVGRSSEDLPRARVFALAIVPAVAAIPLAAQLWSLRAGGLPGTQRLGPLVIMTVLGAAAAGLALGAGLRALFGADLGRRLPPFAARLAVVTSGALAWRLLTLVSINRTNPADGDPFFYHHQANMLADRVGYSEPFRYIREGGLEVPAAIHPPLMSTWLSLASFGGARTYLAHKTMSALLGVLVVVVAGLIARKLAGDRAGIVAAVLVAAYPNLWVIDGILWPEGVYTALVGVAVLAAYRWWERPDLGRAALLGLAIALAALTRGEALFLYPLLVAPLVLFRRGLAWWPKIRAVAVVGLVGLVLFAPWTIRNQRAFGTFVILSTNGDEVLYYANCPDSYGGDLIGYWSFNCQEAERRRTGEPPGNEAEKARYWRDKGEAYARENKDRIPKVVAARILRGVDLFRPGQNVRIQQIEGRPEMATRAGQWAWWTIAPIGVAGLVLLRRRGVLVWPLVSLGLMVLVTTVYAYGTTRFRTPLELALLIAAAVALVHVASREPEPEPESEEEPA